MVATLHCGAGAKRELPTLGPWPKTGCGGIKERTDRFHLVTRALERDVLPLWGQRNIADLGRRDILDLIDGIVERGSPIMARRVHAYLHRLFRWSVGQGILAVNPMTDLPKPGSEFGVIKCFPIRSWLQCGAALSSWAGHMVHAFNCSF